MARSYIDYQTAYGMRIRKQALLFGRKYKPRPVKVDPMAVAAAKAAEEGSGIANDALTAGKKRKRK